MFGSNRAFSTEILNFTLQRFRMNIKRTPPRYPTNLRPLNLESSSKIEERNECVKEKPKCSLFSKTSLSAPRNPFQMRFIPEINPVFDPTEGCVVSQNSIHSPPVDLLTPSSPKHFSFSEPPSPDLSTSNSYESIYSLTPSPHPPVTPPSAGSTPSSVFRYRKYHSKSASSVTLNDSFS